MAGDSSIRIEVLRPTSKLCVPPGASFVTPTLIDSLLGMLSADATIELHYLPACDGERHTSDIDKSLASLDALELAPLDFGASAPASRYSSIGDASSEAASEAPLELATQPGVDLRHTPGLDDSAQVAPIALDFIDTDPLDAEYEDDDDSDSADDEDSEEGEDDEAGAETSGRARRSARTKTPRGGKAMHERMRNLSVAEQQKLARTGEQTERIALERMYGKTVWESLLRNPKLTPPEAARIARMGALPLPLLDLIVGNRAWLSSPQVRRALLANRRLSRDNVLVVLRATPKNELKLMPKQRAYPAVVREAAAKLL